MSFSIKRPSTLRVPQSQPSKPSISSLFDDSALPDFKSTFNTYQKPMPRAMTEGSFQMKSSNINTSSLKSTPDLF